MVTLVGCFHGVSRNTLGPAYAMHFPIETSIFVRSLIDAIEKSVLLFFATYYTIAELIERALHTEVEVK